MKKKICMLMAVLAFGGLFLIGCNKKEAQPEPVPTNEVTEVIEVDLGLEVGK